MNIPEIILGVHGLMGFTVTLIPRGMKFSWDPICAILQIFHQSANIWFRENKLPLNNRL